MTHHHLTHALGPSCYRSANKALYSSRTNRCLRYLLTACVVGISSLATADYSATAQYFPDGQTYPVENAANKLAAANAALTQCQAAHPGTSGYCDLTQLAGQPVQSAAALKAQLPSDDYPLFLWQVTHRDSKVFIAGSIHLLKPGIFPLPYQFMKAFDEAAYLVLEVDTDKLSPAEAQRKTVRYGSLPVNQTLASTLPSVVYTQLGTKLAEYGAPIEHFQGFKPSLVTQQLALVALMSVGYNPQVGLENYFRQRAENKTILELESFDFQLNLLFNAPMQTQIEMTRETLEQMPEFETMTAQMVVAWLRGDDKKLAEITAMQQGDSPRIRAFNRTLIEDRNHTMTDTITGYLNSPGTYFVLVGAAHLIGDEGIPTLLAKAGYPVKRYNSNEGLGIAPTESNQ